MKPEPYYDWYLKWNGEMGCWSLAGWNYYRITLPHDAINVRTLFDTKQTQQEPIRKNNCEYRPAWWEGHCDYCERNRTAHAEKENAK